MADGELTVWIVDDDESLRWVLEKALHQAGMETRSFERAEHLLEAIGHDRPDVLITDVRMPGMDGIALLNRVSRSCPDLPIIVITAHSDLDHAVAAYQGGAFEYLAKPFDLDEAIELVRKAARKNGKPASDGKAKEANEIPMLIGKAPAMQEVFRSIGRLARSSMTVLITGESGRRCINTVQGPANRLSRSTPRRSRRNCWSRSCLAMSGEHLPGRIRGVSDASSRPMGVRCFSMKSAICPPRCRRECCECSRRVNFFVSAGKL